MIRSPSKARRRAFTLIELLVVIAIIAILAAILFPVFAQAKASAKQTSCLSSTKQNQTSSIMYMTDFDDSMPQMYNGGCEGRAGRVGQPSTYMEAYQPYQKNKDIWLCAGGKSTVNYITLDLNASPGRRPLSNIGRNSYLGYYFNYYNYFIDTTACTSTTTVIARPVNMNIVKYPAVTAEFSDGYDDRVTTDPTTTLARAYWLDPGYGFGVQFGMSDRHRKGVNISFLDGHAKWFKIYSVLSQAAIDEQQNIYVEKTNYNAAKIIWDVDARNPYDNPGVWPSNCCTNQ